MKIKIGKVFLHVLYTWLFANCILPVILLIGDQMRFSGNILLDDLASGYLVLILPLLLVSLPSLALIFFFIKPIIVSHYSDFEKLFLWYITAICIAALNVILPIVVLTGGLFFLLEDLSFLIVPVLVSVFISITIRYKYFLKLTKIYKNENNLV